MHDPEYCRRVAEAVGLEWKAETKMGGGICNLVIRQPGRWSTFRPDIDWNDAMLAAEKAGLFFDFPDASLLAGCHPNWLVCFLGNEEPIERRVEHESGPRAICEAILKLKEK